MTLALRRFGVASEPYVPSRLDEGHGLSLAALDAAVARRRDAHRHGRLRVDAASPRSPRQRRAASTSSSPTTTASRRSCRRRSRIVNPHRPDSTYPDRRLAGSGVAFKVAQLLLADEPGGPAAALDLTDLATIGTVADVAPIVGENRAIARLGLERLRTRAAAGHRRAPRARRASRRPRWTSRPSRSPSRRGSMPPAGWARRSRLRGSCWPPTPAEAAAHADALEAANLDPPRPDEDGRRPRHARPSPARPADAGHRACAGPWSVGIVGAGRRPAWPRTAADRRSSAPISATSSGPRAGATASLDLGATLERCARPVHPLSVATPAPPASRSPTDRWDEFRERFLAPRRRVGAAGSADRDRGSTWRCRRSTSTTRLYRELAGLAPCGPGNAEPLVAVLGLTVTRVRAATGGHSQLTLRRDRDVLDGIAFGRPDIAETVREGDRLDVVARLTSRTFGGFEIAPARHPRRGDVRQPPRGRPRSWRCRRADRPRRCHPRRRPRVTRPAARRPPRAGDPYGVGPVGSLARPDPVDRRPAASSRSSRISLLNGRRAVRRQLERRRQQQRRTATATANAPTPAPSNVVIVRRTSTFPGSIVYAKAGNIWVQTGKDAPAS